MHRRPGYLFPSSWDLDSYDPSKILDVNGYYALLGLQGRQRVDLTCAEIARVARRRMYDYHPDRGGFDAEMWQQLSAARRCLIDPATRFVYDNLPSGARFVDETLIAHIRGIQETTEYEQRESDVPCVYYTDVLPSETEIAQWLTVVSYAMKLAQLEGPVRVVFSERWGWEQYAWGRVLHVPWRNVGGFDQLAWTISDGQYLRFCRITSKGGHVIQALLAQFHSSNPTINRLSH